MSEQIGLNTEPLVLWARFDPNEAGRDFAVGDIHGHFPTLGRLLARAEFDERRDRLFAVGDLIDRGPASARFTDYLDRPWFHAVRGNHEQMMIESASDPEMLATWEDNGGGWATRCMSPTAIDRLREVAGRLPIAVEVVTRRGLVGLVHAYLPFPTWAAFRQALEAMSAAPSDSDPQRVQGSSLVSPYSPMGDKPWLWEALYSRATAREMFKRKRHCPETCEALRIPDLHALVLGHTPTIGMPPPSAANIHLIDTGAGYPRAGAALTLLNLETLDTYSEPTAPGCGQGGVA